MIHREPPPEHDLGLGYDLRTLSRRRALTLFAGVGLATLVGCASDDETPATGSTGTGSEDTGAASPTTPSAADTAASCEEIPEETSGPYPGDGSNGPNVLTESGIVRSDIRSSFGSASGTADGIPLTVTLSLLDQTNGCAALAGAAVYLWHCDREGRYSLYSDGVTDQNYLRGVQEADGSGRGDLQHHNPCLLFGTMAAHPLRGVSEPGGGDRRRQHAGDLATCVPRRRVRHRLRHRRV
ncbi:MAG TPA: hypothetical protein VIQ02_21005 [Jiangellaceae bacterium]